MCFNQCVASYIDLPEIIPRMHWTNVFFSGMCLAPIADGLGLENNCYLSYDSVGKLIVVLTLDTW